MGVMEILDAPEGREGAHDESRLVSTLARQAAVAIETARLFRTLRPGHVQGGRVAAAETATCSGARSGSPRRPGGPLASSPSCSTCSPRSAPLGPKERQAATDLLYTFLMYAQGNRG